MKKRMNLLLLDFCFLLSSVPADAYNADAVLPEHLTTIESRAFEGTDIRELRIPQSVTQIADDAFEGLPEDFTAIVDENSYADFWCAEHGVRALRICTLGVTYHSQDEIKEYVSSHPSDRYYSTGYRVNPSVSEQYSYGLISDETISNTFNMLNQCRFIAGLNADVANDTEYEKLVKAAALLNALYDSLTHYPERPDQLSDAKYDELAVHWGRFLCNGPRCNFPLTEKVS